MDQIEMQVIANTQFNYMQQIIGVRYQYCIRVCQYYLTSFNRVFMQMQIYPKTRQELAKQLRKRPKNRQNLYYPSECKDIIKYYLDGMDELNYNFMYSSQKPFEKGQKRVYLPRKVKLSFYCGECMKRWTSMLGLIEIIFSISKQNGRDFVNFKLRLYRQQCMRCMNYGSTKIYSSQIQTVAEIFCLTLTEILLGIPMHKHSDDGSKMDEDVHHHMYELCEACAEGKCFGLPASKRKEKTKVREKTREKPKEKEGKLGEKKVKINGVNQKKGQKKESKKGGKGKNERKGK